MKNPMKSWLIHQKSLFHGVFYNPYVVYYTVYTWVGNFIPQKNSIHNKKGPLNHCSLENDGFEAKKKQAQVEAFESSTRTKSSSINPSILIHPSLLKPPPPAVIFFFSFRWLLKRISTGGPNTSHFFLTAKLRQRNVRFETRQSSDHEPSVTPKADAPNSRRKVKYLGFFTMGSCLPPPPNRVQKF